MPNPRVLGFHLTSFSGESNWFYAFGFSINSLVIGEHVGKVMKVILPMAVVVGVRQGFLQDRNDL
jgi:hypothetical protein